MFITVNLGNMLLECGSQSLNFDSRVCIFRGVALCFLDNGLGFTVASKLTLNDWWTYSVGLLSVSMCNVALILQCSCSMPELFWGWVRGNDSLPPIIYYLRFQLPIWTVVLSFRTAVIAYCCFNYCILITNKRRKNFMLMSVINLEKGVTCPSLGWLHF